MNETLRYTGLICDFDGTLVDSEKQHAKAWRIELEQWNAHTFDFTRTIGVADMTVAKMVCDEFSLSITPEKLLEDKRNTFDAIVEEEGVPVLDGVRQTLEALHQAGVPIVIGSNSRHSYVQRACEIVGFTKFIKAIVCADDVENAKPAPDMFIRAKELLAVKDVRAIVIEDSIDGVTAANNAKIPVVAVTNSFPKEKFTTADYVIDTFPRLLDIMRSDA